MKQKVTWKEALKQPDAWYKTPEALQIAQNILQAQGVNGGWDKNQDRTKPPKKTTGETTIDNGATCNEIRFLAKIRGVDLQSECRGAMVRGINYLLSAQYPNGGFPQFFPLKKGYYTHITFNDDAMTNALALLRDVAKGTPEYAFVDKDRRQRCGVAVTKGVSCILKCQVVINGKKTAWCQQHDEITLAPTTARSYELVSLSGSETVNIVRFLMGEKPTRPVVEAIESAVAWLKQVKITGIRIEKQKDDVVVVPDANASPVWARFYEIPTNRPFFCGRDGVKKYTMAEIEQERRKGYAWYTARGNDLLEKDYPAWRKSVW